MAHLLKTRNLINRYSLTDPILHEILLSLLNEAEETSTRHVDEDSENTDYFDWGPLTDFGLPIATDFQSTGGEQWNVVGVATLIHRAFKVTKDQKFMYYTVDIHNSTIVFGALSAVLLVTIPNGYVCRGITNNLEAHVGSGHAIAIPALGLAYEPAAVWIQDGSNQVIIVRPQGALYPASPANYSVRFSIFIPVVKYNRED